MEIWSSNCVEGPLGNCMDEPLGDCVKRDSNSCQDKGEWFSMQMTCNSCQCTRVLIVVKVKGC